MAKTNLAFKSQEGKTVANFHENHKKFYGFMLFL